MSKLSEVLESIAKKRGLDSIPIAKPKKEWHLREYYDTMTPEKKKEVSKRNTKAISGFWKSMTPEEKKAFCKRRANSLRKFYTNAPEEVRKKQSAKGLEKLVEIRSTEEGRKRLAEAHKNNKVPANRTVVQKDVPRINTYAGVITLSEMEELNQ